jgi:hypothetical protein
MNERNVAALTEIAREALDAGMDTHPVTLAEYLASRGVLVPSALTDEEIRRRLWASGLMVDGRLAAKVSSNEEIDFGGVRRILEQLAKGD